MLSALKKEAFKGHLVISISFERFGDIALVMKK